MVALNANINDDLIFQTAGFNTIRLDAAGTLQLIGGTLETNAGNLELSVNGLGLFAIDGGGRQLVLQIVSGTPCFMNAGSFRIATLGQATTDMDAAPQTKMWGAWTPTLTWATATPASLTTIARYCQIGKTVYFTVYLNSTDSNATTGLEITLPVTAKDNAANVAIAGFEIAGAAGTTYYNPYPYIYQNVSKIYFGGFITATDAQRININLSGHYEVA
jgi:hypothetical protein